MRRQHCAALLLCMFSLKAIGQAPKSTNRAWQTEQSSIPAGMETRHIITLQKTKDSHSTILPMPGWPVKVGRWPQYPVIADLDKDGKKEIIIADRGPSHAYLHVFTYEGKYFSSAWPKRLGSGLSSPAVADINNDGVLDIIVVEAYDLLSSFFPNGRVHVLQSDGSYVPGWPVMLEGGHGYLNSVSVGDVNNDGSIDVVTATGISFLSSTGTIVYFNKLYAFNNDGSLIDGWPVEPDAESIIRRYPRSPLVLVDLDGDNYLEIISGFISRGDPNGYENAIYALEHDGRVMPGYFPVTTRVWNYALASADMNGDGFYEIYSHGRRLKPNGFNDIDWKIQDRVFSPLAFADVNQDGLPELIYGTGARSSYVCVVDQHGDFLPGWPVQTIKEKSDIIDSNPIVGDVDGDNDMEIFIGSYYTNLIFGWHHDGTVVDGFPIVSGNLDNYRLAMSDLDGDGDIEIISANSDSCIYVWDIPSTGPCTNLEWPMYQHNERHTGVYPSSQTNAVAHDADLIPADIALGQNYPNPFNAETVIPYTLSGRAEVTLTIVDITGRTVDVLERGIKIAGRHEAVWNAAGMTSGVYIARLSAGSEVRVGKVLLVR